MTTEGERDIASRFYAQGNNDATEIAGATAVPQCTNSRNTDDTTKVHRVRCKIKSNSTQDDKEFKLRGDRANRATADGGRGCAGEEAERRPGQARAARLESHI